MSGSVTSGPLTSAETVAVRRYCGYGPPSAALQPDPVVVALAALTQDYIDVVRSTFLTNLYLLEADIPATRAKLSINEAAVFKRNAAEVREREGIYRDLRLRLCGTLGISSGPFLSIYIPGAFVV
jgi:hypothetical protein